MLRAVRHGRVVAVVNDQYSRRARGVFVPLFGTLCSTSAGLATLALRTGAPVLPFYIVRDAPDHHTARIEPPLELRRSGDRRKDIETVTAQFNAALEAIIRRYPTQWMWSHRRFRHSPELGADPYAALRRGGSAPVPPGAPPEPSV
jgi:KDO2-lipid IV(A) lauroyltransferase